ncbi:hypothetical protein EVA_18768, partial [gut metagenome]
MRIKSNLAGQPIIYFLGCVQFDVPNLEQNRY